MRVGGRGGCGAGCKVLVLREEREEELGEGGKESSVRE